MTSTTTDTTCKSCNEVLLGTYCHRCGEKTFSPHDKSLSHLVHEVFHFLTHFEGTFLRTLKTVFIHPGQLSADYCSGVRKKYFKPVSFFLFSVIVYLLFSSFQGLNMQFSTYLSKDYGQRFYSLQPALDKMESEGITETELAARYDAKSSKVAKVMLLILIPLSALVLYGLNFRKRKYFFDHYMLSTEALSFYVLTQFILLFLIMIAVVTVYPAGENWFTDSSWVWIAMRISFVAWMIVACRRFYQDKWWMASIKAIIFSFLFIR